MPTIKKLPAGTSEWVARCYCVCAALVTSVSDGHRELGGKLHMLLPRMVLRPLDGRKFHLARGEIHRRCRLFVAGDWRRLIQEVPAPISSAEREQRQQRRDRERGYAVNVMLESRSGTWSVAASRRA